MDLDSILKTRHSVRSYTNFLPPDKDIERILRVAESAPSAGDLRARKIFVVKASSKRSELAAVSDGNTFITEAPFVIIFCADRTAIESYGERGMELYCVQDATIAATYAMLKATELGLGTCWVGAFDEAGVSEVCGLPSHLRPVALLTVGYEK